MPAPETYLMTTEQHGRLRPLLKLRGLQPVSVRDAFEADMRGKKDRLSYTRWLDGWLDREESK